MGIPCRTGVAHWLAGLQPLTTAVRTARDKGLSSRQRQVAGQRSGPAGASQRGTAKEGTNETQAEAWMLFPEAVP